MMKNVNLPGLQSQVATQRDESSYKKLYLAFYKPLFEFSTYLLKDAEVAEEIVSEVMMRIWEMGEDLANIRNLKVYLYKSTKNRCLNYLSRNNKYKTVVLDSEDFEINMDSRFPDPENILIKKELEEGIASAIKSLSPKCQVVYKLIRVDGLCYKEVAEIMNISVKTVDRHLNNALHKLVYSMKIYAD